MGYSDVSPRSHGRHSGIATRRDRKWQRPQQPHFQHGRQNQGQTLLVINLLGKAKLSLHEKT